MKNKDIAALLKKADELRALFVLGQRVIPFLEEIFIFVSEIQPLLDDINRSVQENLKKMPNASKQLSKVTEANELATSEIMDIVDGLVYKIEIISSNLKRVKELEAQKRDNPMKLLEMVVAAVKKGTDLTPLLPQLNTAIKTMKSIPEKDYNQIFTGSEEILQSISDDSNSIMMSLQVQDITAQQIAAVNNLLETVQGKLANILHHFQHSEIGSIVGAEEENSDSIKISQLHRPIAFDPDAIDSISKKEFRQDEVDAIMNVHNTGGKIAEDEPVSMDDIDALFGGQSSISNTEPVKTTETPNLGPEDDFEQFSQDDIDALFGK